jgi:hypothetical protein
MPRDCAMASTKSSTSASRLTVASNVPSAILHTVTTTSVSSSSPVMTLSAPRLVGGEGVCAVSRRLALRIGVGDVVYPCTLSATSSEDE